METNEWVALKDSISKDHIRIEKILFAIIVLQFILFSAFIYLGYSGSTTTDSLLEATDTKELTHNLRVKGE